MLDTENIKALFTINMVKKGDRCPRRKCILAIAGIDSYEAMCDF